MCLALYSLQNLCSGSSHEGTGVNKGATLSYKSRLLSSVTAPPVIAGYLWSANYKLQLANLLFYTRAR